MKRITTLVGLDPGIDTGYCVWSRTERRIVAIGTTDFFAALDIVRTYAPEDTEVVIEDPRMNRPTFDHDVQGARRREKVSQNVGQNKAHAALLVQGCERYGYAVRSVRPRERKWTADQFKRLTGCTQRTSQHARDAARLVVEEFDLRGHGKTGRAA